MREQLATLLAGYNGTVKRLPPGEAAQTDFQQRQRDRRTQRRDDDDVVLH
jgi:hypothetical protein